MQFWVEVTLVIVSLAFVSSFSPVGIVLKVGERARSSQTAPAFDSPAPPPTRIRNNKRHNYPLLMGSWASVKVGDKDDVSDC